MTSYKFDLKRPAKSNGGDRYDYSEKGKDDHMAFYIPQSISRKEGDIAKTLTITIE